MSQDRKKKNAAKIAIDYVKNNSIIGVGTGTTINFFIEELGKNKGLIDGAISTSVATEKLLREQHIPVLPLNSVIDLPIYIDSADEVTHNKHLIKGGGGALTQEKIVAAASKQFVCIIDDSKLVPLLGGFPLPVEVIPMAQSYVAREIAKLGGQPELRQDFLTDNGNIILDIHNLKIENPSELENQLNQITGVVTNGLFAKRPADTLIIATDDGIVKK